MRRWVSGMFVAGLFVLVSAFVVIGPADAAPARAAITAVVAQPTDTTAPAGEGPRIDSEQPGAPMSQETKNKVWIAAIAVVLFGLVYLRNRRRYTKWRAAKKG
ncbi:hypothetical protein [Umezawaea beigongshangensis]|uniref:hypothetical protein n=1 Tax=Umezawaea beigongshangensis TaxID=2780383 RepID=UPI0018F1F01D|nr:hypothetical protein [Umezawaea beigongshangensis]